MRGGVRGNCLRQLVPPCVETGTNQQHRSQAGERKSQPPVGKITPVRVYYDGVGFANGPLGTEQTRKRNVTQRGCSCSAP